MWDLCTVPKFHLFKDVSILNENNELFTGFVGIIFYEAGRFFKVFLSYIFICIIFYLYLVLIEYDNDVFLPRVKLSRKNKVRKYFFSRCIFRSREKGIINNNVQNKYKCICLQYFAILVISKNRY